MDVSLDRPRESAALLAYELRCGLPALGEECARGLEASGLIAQDTAGVLLIVDAPCGFAPPHIQRDAGLFRKHDAGAVIQRAAHVVVVTDSPCPEYWADLWDLGPQILLAGGHTLHDIGHALRDALGGKRYRKTPETPSRLTLAERRLLREVAYGRSNKHIALILGLGEGSVKNGLTRAFDKLGLENRVQAALYYWGLWRLLDGSAAAPVDDESNP